MSSSKSCYVEDCDRTYYCAGLCRRHYEKVRRSGTTHFPTLLERFWEKVEKTERCWNWLGATDGCGYGEFRGEEYGRKAHRISWVIHFGEIPTGLYVCHHCDNAGCVKPEHLFLGTQYENMHDMAHKRGYYQQIVTKEMRTEIRRLKSEGVKQYVIAGQFGLSDATISRVLSGKR